ncbi:hypothetical protein CN168_00040 [Sinorhizobium medicae]|nr:hypothetical protein CN168_00040 [Sinorhizobium medicae]
MFNFCRRRRLCATRCGNLRHKSPGNHPHLVAVFGIHAASSLRRSAAKLVYQPPEARQPRSPCRLSRASPTAVSFDRIRLKDKNMQQIKVLQRPLCV